MARSAVILIHDQHVALIERNRSGETYFLFPGGQVEQGEELEATAVREAREELGIDVELQGLFAEVQMRGKAQHYFRARQIAGEFGSGAGIELLQSESHPNGTHRPVWVPLAELAERDCRPMALAKAVIEAAEKGWPEKPLRFVES